MPLTSILTPVDQVSVTYPIVKIIMIDPRESSFPHLNAIFYVFLMIHESYGPPMGLI